MNIVTRGDFDGLVSSILLTEVENVRQIRFVHPKDVQDGLIQAGVEDIVVNVPYIKGCGLWFDHHISEEDKVPVIGDFKGRFEKAPSAARVIYNYYSPKHREKLDRFKDALEAADKLDSAQLSIEDVTNPSGWILLGLTIDPRSGLGPDFQKYFRWLVEYVKELPIEKVLENKEVKKRTDRILKEQEEHKRLLSKYARLDGNVIVTDFRGLKEKPVGNRFLVYTMFPKANVEMRLFDGHKGAVVVAVGHSIFNRTCKVNVGELLKRYGGGGHKSVGTCQLDPTTAEPKIKEILSTLKANR
ncbi:MAG: exopolyphosphatase [Planctomycetota bacterium]|nr:exopolyphosphatase [Planctomycetota bacterium]